jgi:pre-rRNA-processing protein TSR2
MLLQVLVDEFDTIVDDGSTESVAKDIVKLWEESQAGKTESVIRFEELAEKTSGKRVNAQEKAVSDDEDGEWEDDETTDEEVPQLQDRTEPLARESLVDQDGFTLVQSKKRR